MGLFTRAKSASYPRQWAGMSLDFKLMFVWHGCMMILFATGGFFTTRQELIFAAILMTVLLLLAMRHRRTRNWHWQGVEPKQVFGAGGGVLLTIAFLFAATPLFPPSKPQALPWYLAGFGIGAMNFLSALRLARTSESQFIADCQDHSQGPASEPHALPSVPAVSDTVVWRRWTRTTFTLAFFFVWSNFVVFFYLSGKDFRDGTPAPTTTHTEPVTQHGHTVYVTREQKARDDRLMMISMVGVPSVIAAGFILHYLVGVKVFDNIPSRGNSPGAVLSRKKP